MESNNLLRTHTGMVYIHICDDFFDLLLVSEPSSLPYKMVLKFSIILFLRKLVLVPVELFVC